MKKLIILSGASQYGKTETLICLSKKFKIVSATFCYSPNDFKYICDKNGKKSVGYLTFDNPMEEQSAKSDPKMLFQICFVI